MPEVVDAKFATFTSAGQMTGELLVHRHFQVSIQGTFTGSIRIERRPHSPGIPATITWGLVRAIIGEFEGSDYQGDEPFYYRLLAGGDFVGSAQIRLSRSMGGGSGNIFFRSGGAGGVAATVVVTSQPPTNLKSVNGVDQTGRDWSADFAKLQTLDVVTSTRASELTLAAVNNNLGTDGASPPVIVGTGVRGWLRGIYETLVGTTARELTLDQRNNLAATLLNLLPSSTAQKVLRLEEHGANRQFSYNIRSAAGAAVDAAVHEAQRERRIGPEEPLTATYSRTGTTVTVTTLTPHNFETGDPAFHTGAADAGLDHDIVKVTITTALIYTFQTASVGAAAGAIVVRPSGFDLKYRTGVAVTSLESGW